MLRQPLLHAIVIAHAGIQNPHEEQQRSGSRWLMIYLGLLEINETYEVTDDALIIRNVMRPWAPKKTFDWGRVTRLDVMVKRPDGSDDDVTLWNT